MRLRHRLLLVPLTYLAIELLTIQGVFSSLLETSYHHGKNYSDIFARSLLRDDATSSGILHLSVLRSVAALYLLRNYLFR
jgi:hypothetical protein